MVSLAAYERRLHKRRGLLGCAIGHLGLALLILGILSYQGVEVEHFLYALYLAGFVFNMVMMHINWRLARQL